MKLYQWYKRRWISYLLYFVLVGTVLLSFNKIIHTKESIQCYRLKTMETLPDISEANPRRGKSIFFHETSCQSYLKNKIFITSRQACAVESAARLNPNLDVYLLYSSPGIFKFKGEKSDRFLQELLSYSNVKIMHVDYENYTKGTPVEALYSDGQIESSLHVVSHSSDVLRYLTLWKYGGIYMDLDVVVLKSLEDLPPNFAGVESTDVIASGVLNFDAHGKGHLMVEKCLNDLKDNFNGQEWATNGPGVITRLLSYLCSTSNTDEMLNNECNGFKPYPTKMFYPVRWQEWQMYFEEESMQAVMNLTQDSLVIHVWNKLSYQKTIPLNSNVPYLVYAKKHCPKVVKACDDVF